MRTTPINSMMRAMPLARRRARAATLLSATSDAPYTSHARQPAAGSVGLTRSTVFRLNWANSSIGFGGAGLIAASRELSRSIATVLAAYSDTPRSAPWISSFVGSSPVGLASAALTCERRFCAPAPGKGIPGDDGAGICTGASSGSPGGIRCASAHASTKARYSSTLGGSTTPGDASTGASAGAAAAAATSPASASPSGDGAVSAAVGGGGGGGGG